MIYGMKMNENENGEKSENGENEEKEKKEEKNSDIFVMRYWDVVMRYCIFFKMKMKWNGLQIIDYLSFSISSLDELSANLSNDQLFLSYQLFPCESDFKL